MKGIRKSATVFLDADFTVAPNLTAALANKLAKFSFLRLYDRNVSVMREKRLLTTRQALKDIFRYVFSHPFSPSSRPSHLLQAFRLAFLGLLMHACLRFFRFIGRDGSGLLLWLLTRALSGTDLRPFLFTRKEIEDSLYPGAKRFLSSLPGKKVMVSRSFQCEGKMLEHYRKILSLDALLSNTLILDRRGHPSFKIRVRGATSKKAAADTLAEGPAIALGNGNADLGLADAKGVFLVIANSPSWRLRRRADLIIRDDYSPLLGKN